MSEALRLAELIERDYHDETLAPRKAAAELRRLHAENETLKKSHKESLYYAMGQASALRELNAELVEALRPFAKTDLTNPLVRDSFGFDVLTARAALAKAQGESE